jgi:hypothetical protein
MRWLRLFRRRRPVVGGEIGVPSHRPGSWGKVALPPPLPGEDARSEIPAAAVTGDAIGPPTPPSELVAAQSSVRLGFVDGSQVDLEDGTGAADEFRATASRLLGATEA